MRASTPSSKTRSHGTEGAEVSDLLRILNDPRRLDILAATALLNTPPEQVFDRLTRLAGKILNAPVSLVSLVGKDHQFFKSQTGLPEPWATQRLTALSRLEK
jgi:hypothetical protein